MRVAPNSAKNTYSGQYAILPSSCTPRSANNVSATMSSTAMSVRQS